MCIDYIYYKINFFGDTAAGAVGKVSATSRGLHSPAGDCYPHPLNLLYFGLFMQYISYTNFIPYMISIMTPLLPTPTKYSNFDSLYAHNQIYYNNQ